MASHCCLYLFVIVALWAVCTVGTVNVGVSGQSDVLSRFSVMNSSAIKSLFSNSTVTFKAVTVPTGRTSSDINGFVTSISDASFDLVIGTFNELLASACSYLTLPFYSLSEKLLDPLITSEAYLQGSTTLLVNTVLEELVLASVNFTITVAKRRTIVMLADDVGSRLNILLERNLSIEFRISVVNTSSSSAVRQLLYDSTVFASVDSSVYLIVSSTPGFASSILKEAVYLSMLKSTAYWLVLDLFLDKSEITQFYSTGATIITFQLPNSDIGNQTQLTMAMATDAIQHYIASSTYNITNTTSIMQKIFLTTIDGSVSKLHFNSDNRQSDKFAANLVATDAKSPTDLFLYASWNESVPNSLATSRTKASLQLPVLRLAGVLVDPYVMKTPAGYSGFSINVLEQISANLFTYDLNDLSSMNASTDFLKLVQLGNADLAVNLVELNSAVLNDSRISLSEIPLLTSGVASLGGSATKEIDFLSPLYPLTWNVWFAIILAFVILSATLYLTDKISPNDYKRPKFSVAKAAFFVYSSFVMSKLKSSAVKPSSRIFILILWFASLMYCTTYGTNYFFLLVRTNPNLPFTSLGGLYNMSSNYYWMMVRDSPEYRLLAGKNATDGVYQKVVTVPPVFVPSVRDAVGIIRNSTLPGSKKPIFVGDELTLNYYAARDCYLKSAGKNELWRNLHMVFNKNNISAKLMSDINNRIQELSDRGQLEQIKNNYWSVVLCSASENLITYSELTEVTVDQVAGIFIVLAAAFVLSFLVVALEYVAYMIGLQIQRTRADPKLQFNSSYRAVVTGITPTGIYVKLHGEKEFLPNHMLSPDASKSMTASDLQISYGTVIEITYLGNDPVEGYRIFHKRG